MEYFGAPRLFNPVLTIAFCIEQKMIRNTGSNSVIALSLADRGNFIFGFHADQGLLFPEGIFRSASEPWLCRVTGLSNPEIAIFCSSFLGCPDCSELQSALGRDNV